MEKSIYTKQYTAFIELLRSTREDRGISQTGLAEALGVTQTFISKCERGQRRLDVVELSHWCSALDAEFSEFVRTLESALEKGQ